jgi:hypothetical protein
VTKRLRCDSIVGVVGALVVSVVVEVGVTGSVESGPINARLLRPSRWKAGLLRRLPGHRAATRGRHRLSGYGIDEHCYPLSEGGIARLGRQVGAELVTERGVQKYLWRVPACAGGAGLAGASGSTLRSSFNKWHEHVAPDCTEKTYVWFRAGDQEGVCGD